LQGVIERLDTGFGFGIAADAKHFFNRALGYHLPLAVWILDDDTESPPLKVKWNFVDLNVVVFKILQFGMRLGVLGFGNDGLIHHVFITSLKIAV